MLNSLGPSHPTADVLTYMRDHNFIFFKPKTSPTSLFSFLMSPAQKKAHFQHLEKEGCIRFSTKVAFAQVSEVFCLEFLAQVINVVCQLPLCLNFSQNIFNTKIELIKKFLASEIEYSRGGKLFSL